MEEREGRLRPPAKFLILAECCGEAAPVFLIGDELGGCGHEVVERRILIGAGFVVAILCRKVVGASQSIASRIGSTIE